MEIIEGKMRIIILLMALIVMAQPAGANEWYEGGTLQKATVAEWNKATAENQLATSGDFIASLSAISDIATVKDQQTRDDIKKRSVELKDCVNQSIAGQETPEGKPVAELVIMCTILKPTTQPAQ
jgi:hypothetical protein